MKFQVFVEHADGHDNIPVSEGTDPQKAAALVGTLLGQAGCCPFTVGVSVSMDEPPAPPAEKTPTKPAEGKPHERR